MPAAANQGAGYQARLSKAVLDTDLAGFASSYVNNLKAFKRWYDTYYSPFGTDATFGYQAFCTLAGDANAANDATTYGSAVTELLNAYNVMIANATIASGGALTTPATGHDFLTSISKVIGNQT